MKKLILIILAAVMCFILVGCTTPNEQVPYNTDDCREVIIGDMVFQIPNNAEETLYSNEPSEYVELDLYDMYTYIIYDENGAAQHSIQITTANGQSGKNLYNYAVEMYSDINAYYAGLSEKYPEYDIDTVEYDTVKEELPTINGVEYQTGNCWTISSEGYNNQAHVLCCMIDDIYYQIYYTGAEEVYDRAYWDEFISSVKKL